MSNRCKYFNNGHINLLQPFLNKYVYKLVFLHVFTIGKCANKFANLSSDLFYYYSHIIGFIDVLNSHQNLW